VTGIRQDASARAFPSSVEEEKPEAERGLFLHPEHYGHPRERGIAFARYPEGIRKSAVAQFVTPSALPLQEANFHRKPAFVIPSCNLA
jgi:hypothetical protein